MSCHWSFAVKTHWSWNGLWMDKWREIRNEHKNELFDLWHNCLKLRDIPIGILAVFSEIFRICSKTSPSDIFYLNFRKKSKMNFLNTALYARSCAKMEAQSKLTECPYFARIESVPKPIGRNYMTRTWNGKLPVCVFWAKIRNAHEMSLSSDYHCN